MGIGPCKTYKTAKKITTNYHMLSKYNAHTEPLFKKLKLLKLTDLLKLNELKFYYKYVNDKLPEYFNKANDDFNLITNNDVHEHNTRQRNRLHIIRTNHKYAEKCIRHSIPHTINNTPDIIKNKINTHSLQGYSKYIKNTYIQGYNENCTIHNCYICGRTD